PHCVSKWRSISSGISILNAMMISPGRKASRHSAAACLTRTDFQHTRPLAEGQHRDDHLHAANRGLPYGSREISYSVASKLIHHSSLHGVPHLLVRKIGRCKR